MPGLALEERSDYLGVQLRASSLGDHPDNQRVVEGITIWAGRAQGIVDIHHGEDASQEADLLARPPVWLAFAVEPLVVLQDER